MDASRPRRQTTLWGPLALVLLTAALTTPAQAQQTPPGAQAVPLPKTLHKLAQHEPLTVVCLGDSVTGVYYHTGGRRAYPEMLPFALRLVDPRTDVKVINAGISGNTTADALARLDKDVLAHAPDLVTVMFGLNDAVRLTVADFEANLRQIVERCQSANAEVILCTPNGIIESAGYPGDKLREYIQTTRRLGAMLGLPVCDIHAAYEQVRATDPLKFRLLMSDAIHPNMDGDKINAQEICRTITGAEVSLAEVEPPEPALVQTQSRLRAGEPIRVLAMTPYDKLIADAFHAVVPDAQVVITPWEVSGLTITELEQQAVQVRNADPRYDLVLIAVPLAATASITHPQESDIKSYIWTLNLALSFGVQEWDVVAAVPAVLQPDVAADMRLQDQFARQIIRAQHVNRMDRGMSDQSSAQALVTSWLREQLRPRP